MKVCIKFLFLLLFSCKCFAESSEGLSFEYKVAIRDGAKAKVTVHVIDDNGLSLSNVNVRIYFRMTSGSSQGTVEQGKTNEDGTFCAEGRTTGFVFVSAEKENYYVSLTKYKASSLAPEKLHEGKWLPWNPTISVVLREIQNPVPMYVSVAAAKNNRWHMIPFPANVEVGFDCKKNAFVAPYGNGEISDFVVRVSSLSLPEEFQKKIEDARRKIQTATNVLQKAQFEMEYQQLDGFYYEFVLNVPDPDGGFIRKAKRADSTFISEYEAPIIGYLNTFKITVKDVCYPNSDSPEDLSKEEYLIFRSRIVRDEKGEIVSSHYGKIYGPIIHGIIREKKLGCMTFDCYFNPEPNNRSIEFDGKNNLFFPQYKTSNFIP